MQALRIANEWKSILRTKRELAKDGIAFAQVGERDVGHYTLTLSFSEPTSPYYGQSYNVDIKLPRDYPITPPVCRFTTRIFHPNVRLSDGDICLNILKSEDWTPVMSLTQLGYALLALCNGPNCDSPHNCDAGNVVRDGDTRAYKSLIDYYYHSN